MRIAIAADDPRGLESVVSHHFGRCPYYVFVDLEGKEVQKVEAMPNPGAEHHAPGEVPAFIHAQGAEVIIAGGMGQRAITAFHQYGIRPYTGASGSVRHVLEALVGGALEDARPCGGHEGGEHEEHDEVHRLREEAEALHHQLEAAKQRLDELTGR
jgi:predicted Fe-Mo cluster-binding NifX family protein